MDRKGNRRAIKLLALLIFSFAAIVFSLLVGIYVYAKNNISFKSDERMFLASLAWNSTTFYADSDKNDDVYTPIAIETVGSTKKAFYPSDEISRYIKEGFISVEDRIFYEHRGIDWKRTLYAASNYITRKQKMFGASTITQQVIKNISGDNDITVGRKIKEILRAINIEQKFSKDQILEVYLNIIPMGENIFGVGLASRAYFGKEPSELSAAEAATLIGITNAPTAYNPYSHPDACLNKRNIVLGAMKETAVISEFEYLRACDEPLSVMPRDMREDRYDSWFTETVISDIARDLSREMGISESAALLMIERGGYSIYTTMDIKNQEILEQFFENKENFPPEISDGLEFSMAVADARTGDLSAIVGRVGEKRANRILNYATLPHTPASTLKPIALYAPLIDEGKISWSTVFDDIPIKFFETDEGYRPYPRNSPDVYDGLVNVARAVRDSKNTVALRLYEMRTAEVIYNDLINRYGINTLVGSKSYSNVTDLAPSPLGLGQLSVGIPLTKMVEAYGAFANGGVLNELRSYVSVSDSNGKVLLENEPTARRIYKESTASIMNKLLGQVTEDGTARSIKLKDYVDTAGKTGTASGCREKMFIGYTPYYVGGIWCGYDGEQKAVNTSAHLSVWDKVMTAIHREVFGGMSPMRLSESGIVRRPYCIDSGELYSKNCMLDPRGSRLEFGYFTEATAPKILCTCHVLCKYDSVTKGVALYSCPHKNTVDVSLIRVEDRSFPIEIYISDAEFVYRDIKNTAENDFVSDLPYFYSELAPGEYAGISNRRRQFNRMCVGHDN